MDENLIVRRNELKKRIVPLEWDKKLNQIHFAKDHQLKAYRQELEQIEKEIFGVNNAETI